MYLSKVSLVSARCMASEWVALSRKGIYGAHQLLWQLFTQQQERSFLFREETFEKGQPCYYVLSQHPPEPMHARLSVHSKAFQPKLQTGSRLAFKLRVNPTRCLKNSANKYSRHDVLMHAKYQAKQQGIHSQQQIKSLMDNAAQQWISEPERLARWGISLLAEPDIERYTQHKSAKKNQKQPIQFSSVDFQGVLRVEQPDLFLQQYACGFGRAKALGCGLMLIRPV